MMCILFSIEKIQAAAFQTALATGSGDDLVIHFINTFMLRTETLLLTHQKSSATFRDA